jgi:hypothetical protein
MHYRALNCKPVVEGSTVTDNLSSGGVAFEAPADLKPGAYVELAIKWPLVLQGCAPVELVVRGRVMWNNAGLAAVRMTRAHFRAQSKASAAGGFPLP